MNMPFPLTHCSRCCEPTPDHRYIYVYIEWRLVGKLKIPVPLCSTCYFHTLKVSRKKHVVLMLGIAAAIIGMFLIQDMSFGDNNWVGTIGFIGYIVLWCGIMIGGVPKFLRPDFLQLDNIPSSPQVHVRFANVEYQAKVEQLGTLVAGAEKLFADAAKKRGPPRT